MTITKSELIELGACYEGLNRFIEQTNNTDEPVSVVSLVGGKNTTYDLLWLAEKKVPDYSLQNLSRDCALVSLELIKAHLTDELYNDVLDYITNNGTTGRRKLVERLLVSMELVKEKEDKNACTVVCGHLYKLYSLSLHRSMSTPEGKERVNKILVKIFS